MIWPAWSRRITRTRREFALSRRCYKPLVLTLFLVILHSYHSRRLSDFSSWDKWEDDLRMEILEITRRPFCSAGYLAVLTNAKGELPEMKGFCDGVKFEAKDSKIKDVKEPKNHDQWRSKRATLRLDSR